jgi:hypothetical protein
MGVYAPLFIGTAIYLLLGILGSIAVGFLEMFDDKAYVVSK